MINGRRNTWEAEYTMDKVLFLGSLYATQAMVNRRIEETLRRYCYREFDWCREKKIGVSVAITPDGIVEYMLGGKPTSEEAQLLKDYIYKNIWDKQLEYPVEAEPAFLDEPRPNYRLWCKASKEHEDMAYYGLEIYRAFSKALLEVFGQPSFSVKREMVKAKWIIDKIDKETRKQHEQQ